MTLRYLLLLSLGLLALHACDDDDEGGNTTPDFCEPAGGTLAGGPFALDLDCVADTISGLTLTDAVGTRSSYLIADDEGNIVGLPKTLADVAAYPINDEAPGDYSIYHISFEDALEGNVVGGNIGTLEGCHQLSNPIAISLADERTIAAATLDGGPFAFAIDDEADFVSDIAIEGTRGENSSYLVTDTNGIILGTPPTLEALEDVDFNDAGAGVCLLWYLEYDPAFFEDSTQLVVGGDATALQGCFFLSNSLEVVRTCTVDAGSLSIAGGDTAFNFIADDGNADFVDSIVLDTTGLIGSGFSYVVTDTSGLILGTPPTLDDVYQVDFDQAGGGVCLIWHVAFQDSLTGFAMGENAGDIGGCFDLSDSLVVNRLDTCAAVGGTLTGGPYGFDVMDGSPDFISGLTLADAVGDSSNYLLTDTALVILEVLPTLDDVLAKDFDTTSTGVCLLWHLSATEEIEELAAGNSAGDLQGCFQLSNPITIRRD